MVIVDSARKAIAELCRRADCEVLLDVNNIFVSAFNHEFNAMDFLRGDEPYVGEIVPVYFMCAAGGWMLPSGT